MSTVIGILYIETVGNNNDDRLLDELFAMAGVEMILSLSFGPYDLVALIQAADEKGLCDLRNAVGQHSETQKVQLAVADDIRPSLAMLEALGLIGPATAETPVERECPESCPDAGSPTC